jgi:hypothetical protein
MGFGFFGLLGFWTFGFLGFGAFGLLGFWGFGGFLFCTELALLLLGQFSPSYFNEPIKSNVRFGKKTSLLNTSRLEKEVIF